MNPNHDNLVGFPAEQSAGSVRERSFRKYASLLTRDLLTKLYFTENKSTVDISRELGVAINTVREYMAIHGLERREAGEAGGAKSKVHHFDEKFFSQVDTHDKAYMLGFILGDGCLSQRVSSRRLTVAVADSDREIVEAMADRLGCATLLTVREATAKNEQDKAILVVGSTPLVNDLVRAGIPMSPKSGIEPFLEQATPALTWSFLRGLSDADGCIRVYERTREFGGKVYGPYQKVKWSITIGLPCVEGICKFLQSEGFALPAKCIQLKQGTSLFEVSSSSLLKEVRTKLYQDGSLWLPRKREAFFKIA